MTAVVWANILLAIPFLVTFIAVPLWWTFKRSPAAPDHSEAHAYLRNRTTFADALTRRTARTRTPVHTAGRTAA
ncbi:MAG TPA: hypothetical protein VFJ07_22995 [Streptosporangiaceae bacterium]|nr:hypothetical protein [Streptosporangiaceae bacterium]